MSNPKSTNSLGVKKLSFREMIPDSVSGIVTGPSTPRSTRSIGNKSSSFRDSIFTKKPSVLSMVDMSVAEFRSKVMILLLIFMKIFYLIILLVK
jgi:hypothetical protein